MSKSYDQARLRLPFEAVEQLRTLVETYDRLKKDFAPPTNSVAPVVIAPPAVAPPVPAGPPAIHASHPGTDSEVEILRLRLASPRDLWWTDLVQAELCVLELLPEAYLRARIGGWRRRMQEVVGTQRYAEYLSTAPDPATATAEQLRADISECVRAVYYFYSSYGVAAGSRSDVTQLTFNVALCILAVQGVIALIIRFHAPPFSWWPTLTNDTVRDLEYLIATSAAAVLGSVVSVQTRLQDPSVNVDPFYRYVQTHADKLSIAYVSTIFAAIFGLVMFALLGSGLVGGNAFPHVASLLSPKPDPPFSDADFVLLLVYGFLSGFAERLVPDALTRIAARTIGSGTSGDGTQAPATNGTPGKLMTSLPSINLAVGAKGTFTATVSGSMDAIAATSSDAGIATVDTDAKKGPGPVTFTVVANKAGQAAISVKSGTQTATVIVTVT